MSNEACEAAGVVTAVNGCFVTVRLASENCASCGCCAGSVREIRLKTADVFSVGEKVFVRQDEGTALKYAAIFYGTPVVFMTAAAFITGALFNLSEIGTAFSALVAIFPAWPVIKKLSTGAKYPEITRLNL